MECDQGLRHLLNPDLIPLWTEATLSNVDMP